MNPDKPHAYRRRILSAAGCEQNACGMAYAHGYLTRIDSNIPCNVCGGSQTLLIHDVEAARFRKRWIETAKVS